jgi:hypothetical protein
MATDHVPEGEYKAVATAFNEDEVAALVNLIVVINAWNAIGVTIYAWVPGSYHA